MLAAIEQRLEAKVPALANRVDSAANFAEMMRTKALPQHGTTAYVLPLGLVGRQPDAAAGMFTQIFEDTVAVELVVHGHTPAAQAALADLRGFIMSVVNALAGWQPGDEVGVFRLVRGGMISAATGVIIYQIDFAITDQLRIIP